VLKQRSNNSWKKEKVPKAFCGLLRCGECGMMITGEQKTKYYKGANRTALTLTTVVLKNQKTTNVAKNSFGRKS
jgi:hypothetical protein